MTAHPQRQTGPAQLRQQCAGLGERWKRTVYGSHGATETLRALHYAAMGFLVASMASLAPWGFAVAGLLAIVGTYAALEWCTVQEAVVARADAADDDRQLDLRLWQDFLPMGEGAIDPFDTAGPADAAWMTCPTGCEDEEQLYAWYDRMLESARSTEPIPEIVTEAELDVLYDWYVATYGWRGSQGAVAD